MASKAFFMAMILAVAISPAMATDYMVGDDKGWGLGVNYTDWAAGKDFRIGDTLMFMYNSSNHNVLKVTGPEFQNCSKNASLGGPINTGKDLFPLNTLGKKWYICSIGDHCSKGMKLVINVNEALAPAPAPTPTSAASKIAKSSAWMLATTAAYWIMA